MSGHTVGHRGEGPGGTLVHTFQMDGLGIIYDVVERHFIYFWGTLIHTLSLSCVCFMFLSMYIRLAYIYVYNIYIIYIYIVKMSITLNMYLISLK